MKDQDYIIIGGLAVILYLLLRHKNGLASGGGAGSGGTGAGCATCVSPSTALRCSSGAGYGAYTQGAGPTPPEASTSYRPPAGNAWDADGFHLGFDLSF